ncbi:MAG TPA: helix-turn-helix transcriptional regulator [Brumimicrobium sp.]|nr:helix-turn-helix transcriptional regulator [Brumimicrobium sp.]
MATYGEFLRAERNKKGLTQSEFGQPLGIIMTDISKIERGKKKFPFPSLKVLAEFLGKDYFELKNLYVADKLVEEVHKYKCSDAVFAVAESQSKYLE